MVIELLHEAAVSLACAHLASEFLTTSPRKLLIAWRQQRSWRTLAALSLVAVQCVRAIVWPLRERVHSWSLPTRLGMLVSAHTCACAFDCRIALGRKLHWKHFLRSLTRSSLYVLPAAPILVLFGSALLLVGTSLFRLVGINPLALRWLVDLGALHSPCWLVHVQTRRSVLHGSSELPLHAAEEDGALVRSQRLLRFVGRI